MIERELLDTAIVPGGGELRLFRRQMKNGDEFSIALSGNELMNSRLSGSEEALATLSCSKLSESQPRVLIGGYGMGFTLREALEVLSAEAKVEVVELVPKIIKWAKDQMVGLTDGCLDDSRVHMVIDDVVGVISNANQHYDAILLDVDNGPDGISNDANDQLYSMAGLARAKQAMRSGGILAVWSSSGDLQFTARLHKSGFSVEEHKVSARGNGKGAKHIIWLARKT